MAKKKNAGLGRGLNAIFLDNALNEETENNENLISNLKISQIDPKSDQPRKHFDKEALEALATSIMENGLLQPILVREDGFGKNSYEIIAGERRWRAAKLAGLSEIPAIVIDGDELKRERQESAKRADDRGSAYGGHPGRRGRDW